MTQLQNQTNSRELVDFHNGNENHLKTKLNLEIYFIVKKCQLKTFQNQVNSREYACCPESLTKPMLEAKQV